MEKTPQLGAFGAEFPPAVVEKTGRQEEERVAGHGAKMNGIRGDGASPRTAWIDEYTTFSYPDPMSVKSSVSLTKEQAAFARAMVEAGRYASVSAVIQQGLELLRSKTEDEELERAALRKLLKRRRKGPFISSEEMGERVDAMIDRKRRERGL
jgi:antitoxin ParD1/3/4